MRPKQAPNECRKVHRRLAPLIATSDRKGARIAVGMPIAGHPPHGSVDTRVRRISAALNVNYSLRILC
jgi:hypothetical protein